jgi:hypothetical protein
MAAEHVGKQLGFIRKDQLGGIVVVLPSVSLLTGDKVF